MQRLSERLESYSLCNVLDDYCSHLHEIELEERACTPLPIARYESDFVSVTNSKEFFDVFRSDYIKIVTIESMLADNCATEAMTADHSVVESLSTESNIGHGDLLNEMRLHFKDPAAIPVMTDLELLLKLEKYLDNAGRSKRGYAELLKSISPSVLTTYRDKLIKKTDSKSKVGIPLKESTALPDIKSPRRGRGSFKRKLPAAVLAIGDLGETLTVPTALLDGDRIIKKFRRRRRLGVLVTSNAAIAAAKKAAASLSSSSTSGARTPSSARKSSAISDMLCVRPLPVTPVPPRGVKWAVKGSGKTPRGAVHPSDVIRTFMSDLDAVGVYAKGGDVDRWLAAAQRSSVLCVNPLIGYSAVSTATPVLGVTNGVEDHVESTASASEIVQQPSDPGPGHPNNALQIDRNEDGESKNGDENGGGDTALGEGVNDEDAFTIDSSSVVSPAPDSAACITVPSDAVTGFEAVGDPVAQSLLEPQQTPSSSSLSSTSCVLPAAAKITLVDVPLPVPHSSSPTLHPSTMDSSLAAPVPVAITRTVDTPPLPLPPYLPPPSLPQPPTLLQKSIVPTALENIPKKILAEQLAEQSDDGEKHTNSRSASAVAGDCMSLCRDSRDVFDKQSSEARKLSLEGARRRWDASIALAMAMQTPPLPLPQTQQLHSSSSSSSSSCVAISRPPLTSTSLSTTSTSMPLLSAPLSSSSSVSSAQQDTQMGGATYPLKTEKERERESGKAFPADGDIGGSRCLEQHLNLGVSSSGGSEDSLYSSLIMKLEDMPVSACRIVNPFSSGNSGCWDWVTAPTLFSAPLSVHIPVPSLAPVSAPSSSSVDASMAHGDEKSATVSSGDDTKAIGSNVSLNSRSLYSGLSNTHTSSSLAIAAVAVSSVRCKRYAEGLIRARGVCFNHAVQRTKALLDRDMNAIIVDDCPGEDRELRTTHRAVLTGAVLTAAFSSSALNVSVMLGGKGSAKKGAHDGKRGEKDGEVHVKEEVRSERGTSGNSGAVTQSMSEQSEQKSSVNIPAITTSCSSPPCVESSSTSKRKDINNNSSINSNSNYNSNKHLINSSDLWGPVLVVCKGRDLKAWEEGLGVVFRGQALGSARSDGSDSNSPSDVCATRVKEEGVHVKSEFSGIGGSSSSGGIETRIRFVGYYGSDADRAQIRSYFTPNEGDSTGTGPGVWGGLYGERSPCHVMLATYESYFADIQEFSDVLWHSVVLDSPWGLISNTRHSKSSVCPYTSLRFDLMNIKARHRLFTCASLVSSAPSHDINSLCSSSGPKGNGDRKHTLSPTLSKSVVLPDLVSCAVMLFPHLQSVVQFSADAADALSMEQTSIFIPDLSCKPSLLESCIDSKSAIQLKRLLGCVTVVCVADSQLEGLARDTDTTLSSASLSLSPPSSLPLSDTKSVSTTLISPSPPISQPAMISSSLLTTVPSSLESPHTALTSTPLLITGPTGPSPPVPFSTADSTMAATSTFVTTIGIGCISVLGSTPDITHTSAHPFSVRARNPPATAAYSLSMASSVTVEHLDSEDVLQSLPWMQWRGVTIVPKPSFPFPPSSSSAVKSLEQCEPSISSTHTGTASTRCDPVTSSFLTVKTALRFDDVEHTAMYRDEELERELDYALSKRAIRSGSKAAPKANLPTSRDAPCVLRRKIVTRTGTGGVGAGGRNLGSRDRTPGRHFRSPGFGTGTVVSTLSADSPLLPSVTSADRERDSGEKRSYSMLNRKASARVRNGPNREQSDLFSSDDFCTTRALMNENENEGDMDADGDGDCDVEDANDNVHVMMRRKIPYFGISEVQVSLPLCPPAVRLLSQPVKRRTFQEVGTGRGFDPSDFLTSANSNTNTNSNANSSINANSSSVGVSVSGSGRIRGEWINALIAAGPTGGRNGAGPGPNRPPALKNLTGSGTTPPSLSGAVSVSKVGVEKSSLFRLITGSDHNEDDFTAIDEKSASNADRKHALQRSRVSDSPMGIESALQVPTSRTVLKGDPITAIRGSNNSIIVTSRSGDIDVALHRDRERVHVKVPRKKEVPGSDDSSMVPWKKMRAEREVKALFPARLYPVPLSHSNSISSASARDAVSLRLDIGSTSVKTCKMQEGRQGVKQQSLFSLPPPFRPSSSLSSSSSSSSTGLPPPFAVLPSSPSSSAFSILSKAPLLSSVSTQKPLTAVTADSIDRSTVPFSAPQQSLSPHASNSDPAHNMSIEELNEVAGDGEGMGKGEVDNAMDIEMEMNMDFSEDLSLFNSDEQTDRIGNSVQAERGGVSQHAPSSSLSSSSSRKMHPSASSNPPSSTSTLKSKNPSGLESRSRSPPTSSILSLNPSAYTDTHLPPLAVHSHLHAGAGVGLGVGGTVSGLHRAKPGPKPRLQFTSDGEKSSVRVLLSKGPGAGRTVPMTQMEEKLKFVTRHGAKWQAFIDCPARLRFLGHYSSEKRASLAFDIAYEQRTRHMANPSIPPPSSPLSSPLLKSSVAKDKDMHVSISGDMKTVSRVRNTQSKEDTFGEKIASGALSVSDALLLLRCTALRKKMKTNGDRDDEAPVSVEVKKPDRIPLNFNTLSNSLATGSSLLDKDKDRDKDIEVVVNPESELVNDIAAQKETALLLEAMREKCLPFHSDINDTGSPTLDCVLSVLSTDSLLRGVRAMAAPHSTKCEDTKIHGEKEDCSIDVHLNSWSHSASIASSAPSSIPSSTSSSLAAHDHRQTHTSTAGLLAYAMLINKNHGMSTRVTGLRTILGRATQSVLALGNALSATPSSSLSNTSAVSGLSVSKLPSHASASTGVRDSTGDPLSGRAEQFVVLGGDPSFAMRHAEIYWVALEGSFFIRNISSSSSSSSSSSTYNGHSQPQPHSHSDGEVRLTSSSSAGQNEVGVAHCVPGSYTDDIGNGAARDGNSGDTGLITTHATESTTDTRTDVGLRTDSSSGVRYGGSVYVQGVEVTPGARGVRLESHSVVQIGCAIFSFVLPSPSFKATCLQQESDTPTQQRLSLAQSLLAAVRTRDLSLESGSAEALQILFDESAALDERAVTGGLQRQYPSDHSHGHNTHTELIGTEPVEAISSTRAPPPSSRSSDSPSTFTPNSSNNSSSSGVGANMHMNNIMNSSVSTDSTFVTEDNADPKKKRKRRTSAESLLLVPPPLAGQAGPHPVERRTSSNNSSGSFGGLKRLRALQALRSSPHFYLCLVGGEDRDKERENDREGQHSAMEVVKSRRAGSISAVCRALQQHAHNHPLSCIDTYVEGRSLDGKEKEKTKAKPKKKEKEAVLSSDVSIGTGAGTGVLLTPSLIGSAVHTYPHPHAHAHGHAHTPHLLGGDRGHMGGSVGAAYPPSNHIHAHTPYLLLSPPTSNPATASSSSSSSVAVRTSWSAPLPPAYQTAGLTDGHSRYPSGVPNPYPVPTGLFHPSFVGPSSDHPEKVINSNFDSNFSNHNNNNNDRNNFNSYNNSKINPDASNSHGNTMSHVNYNAKNIPGNVIYSNSNNTNNSNFPMNSMNMSMTNNVYMNDANANINEFRNSSVTDHFHGNVNNNNDAIIGTNQNDVSTVNLNMNTYGTDSSSYNAAKGVMMNGSDYDGRCSNMVNSDSRMNYSERESAASANTIWNNDMNMNNVNASSTGSSAGYYERSSNALYDKDTNMTHTSTGGAITDNNNGSNSSNSNGSVRGHINDCDSVSSGKEEERCRENRERERISDEHVEHRDREEEEDEDKDGLLALEGLLSLSKY